MSKSSTIVVTACAMLWLTAWALAIPGYRLSLEAVLRHPHRLAKVRLLSRRDEPAERGHRWLLRLTVLGRESPPLEVEYFEAWPYRMPDGKVEAPIWTGSGLERDGPIDQVYTAILTPAEPPHELLRLEPEGAPVK